MLKENVRRQKVPANARLPVAPSAFVVWGHLYVLISSLIREEAVDKLAKFLEMKERFPQSEMPRWSIATFYEEAEQYPEAIAEFEELVALKPDYCVAFLHLGSCLIEEERFEDAIKALEAAHALAVAQSHDAPRMEAEMLLENAREELEDA